MRVGSAGVRLGMRDSGLGRARVRKSQSQNTNRIRIAYGRHCLRKKDSRRISGRKRTGIIESRFHGRRCMGRCMGLRDERLEAAGGQLRTPIPPGALLPISPPRRRAKLFLPTPLLRKRYLDVSRGRSRIMPVLVQLQPCSRPLGGRSL